MTTEAQTPTPATGGEVGEEVQKAVDDLMFVARRHAEARWKEIAELLARLAREREAVLAALSALEASAAQAHDNAIEKAAKVCERAREQFHDRFTSLPYDETVGRLCESSRAQAAHQCFNSIIALKGAPDADAG